MSFTQRVLPARSGWTVRGKGSRLILIGFAVLLFTVMTCAMTQGATFTVNSTGDGPDTRLGDGICETAPGNAICTLRAATQEANAAMGPDVIVFAAGLAGQTLMLTGGRLDIGDDLTIDGPGAVRLRVNGGGRDIFRIPVNRIAVALNGLTLESGPTGDGEAIQINGSRNTLTVADATLIGNGSGDGIRINGDFNWVSIVDVVLMGHQDNLQVGSGGVCSITMNLPTCYVNEACPMGETCVGVLGHNNTVDVADSTIRRASQDGVAISGSNNTVTVQDSTISENGLPPPGTDPAVFANDGLDVNGAGNAVWILQVMVSGNGEHGVDIEGPDNQVVLEHSTVTNNASDGVIIQDHINRANTRSTVFVQHSIIAGNRGERSSVAFRGADVFDAFGSNNFISGGYNLVGNATASRGPASPLIAFDGPGDQAGTATNPIDARLGPLADNGGPTLTHALLPGSPAINAGDPHFTPPPEFDQRGPGFPRVRDGRIDIGALEGFVTPEQPEGPDLLVDQAACLGEEFRLVIRNAGTADVESPGFVTNITMSAFTTGRPTVFRDQPRTGELPRGMVVDLSGSVPARCLEVGCDVSIQVDSLMEVTEAHEDNNSASFMCGPPPQPGTCRCRCEGGGREAEEPPFMVENRIECEGRECSINGTPGLTTACSFEPGG